MLPSLDHFKCSTYMNQIDLYAIFCFVRYKFVWISFPNKIGWLFNVRWQILACRKFMTYPYEMSRFKFFNMKLFWCKKKIAKKFLIHGNDGVYTFRFRISFPCNVSWLTAWWATKTTGRSNMLRREREMFTFFLFSRLSL